MRTHPHTPYYYSLRHSRPGGGGGSRGWLPPRAAPQEHEWGAAPAGLLIAEVRAGHTGGQTHMERASPPATHVPGDWRSGKVWGIDAPTPLIISLPACE